MQMDSTVILWVYAVGSFLVSMLGYWGYKKSGDKDNMQIILGISFGLFAIAYILVLDGLGVLFANFIALFRVAAFIFLIYGMLMPSGRQ